MASPVALPATRPETAIDPLVPAPRPAPPQSQTPDKPPTRLMIEEIGHTGVYVYKVLDQITGKVIAQIPREEIVRLSQTDTYASGAVIDTQA